MSDDSSLDFCISSYEEVSSPENYTPMNSQNKRARHENGKSLEEIYQKKTQLEHILLRPDSYIGSIEPDTRSIWVLNEDSEGIASMVEKEITFVPGLYKIFDEILVNAADNKQRDSSMRNIKVEINVDAGEISVYNDGRGIPVELHSEHNIYIPELIFGHLLTSSNYNDNEKKVTGGRNGFGAKLTNVFSSMFTIETADGRQKYKQTFTNNMSFVGSAKISKSKKNWTKVTFKPDLEKFKMDRLDDDIVALMKKRVYDLAGCTDRTVNVYLNRNKIEFKKFSDYCKLYLDDGAPFIYEEPHQRWQVAVSISDGRFQQTSFVNSISTWKGGSHVKHVSDRIVKLLQEEVSRKHRSSTLKPHHIRNHIWIFVNAMIENPSFDSQTKENLTSRVSSFGSSCELSDLFIRKVFKCGVVDKIISWASFNEGKEIKKLDGKKRCKLTGIVKLEDANKAGGKQASKCTLILTEGDSAKALAMSGLSVVGRDYYGVFPLKGKLLNVRDCSVNQLVNNAEINFLKQILGLQSNKVYSDTSELRYGHVIIMTDQDHDGSHIKGLVINMFHHFWPSLLEIPGFLTQFITPIVRARKAQSVVSFYTIPEYETWRDSISSDEVKKWSIKYYKGLGTSTSKEGKEYFSNLLRHQIAFKWGDPESENTKIELVFSKKKVSGRKLWLEQFEPGTYMDYGEGTRDITYTEFIDRELILFSNADNERSIPSLMDGLKPGQRKIMFACFKRNIVKEIKVGQLSGVVSQIAAYHHGEMSLSGTIVNLAQDYVGSNNINLLQPIGQFGTRHLQGKDSASSRYIFTSLSTITRKLFHPDDDSILKYLEDDGMEVEPEWYAPVIPMVLVNGGEGIGTGWSTFIPNYNPKDLIASLYVLLDAHDASSLSFFESIDIIPQIHPWYSRFIGDIKLSDRVTSYDVFGVLSIIDSKTLRVTELPIKKSTESFKENLEKLIAAAQPLISDYESHNTDLSIDFIVNLSSNTNVNDHSYEEWLKILKLQSSLSINNMVLFNRAGKLKCYSDPREVILEFFNERITLYKARKELLLRILQKKTLKLNNQARFISEIVTGDLVISKRTKAMILAILVNRKYDQITKCSDLPGSTTEVVSPETGYGYLLDMKLWSLTLEKIQLLHDEIAKLTSEYDTIMSTSVSDMWRADLGRLSEDYGVFEKEQSRELQIAKEAMAAKMKQSKKRRHGIDVDPSITFKVKKLKVITSTPGVVPTLETRTIKSGEIEE